MRGLWVGRINEGRCRKLSEHNDVFGEYGSSIARHGLVIVNITGVRKKSKSARWRVRELSEAFNSGIPRSRNDAGDNLHGGTGRPAEVDE